MLTHALGTPVDCVSLALSGALFSWSKPVLVCFLRLKSVRLRMAIVHSLLIHAFLYDIQVISGVNKGSSCGHNM